MKNRIEWADMVKGICAFLVILVHTEKAECYALLFRPFFLFAFFFVSGYFVKEKNHFFKELLKTICILLISLLVKFVYLYVTVHEIMSVDTILGGIYQTHKFYPVYPPIIWFVPCIFVAKQIFISIYRWIKNEYFRIAVCIALSVIGIFLGIKRFFLPWHIQTALISQVFLLGGYLLKKYESFVQNNLKILLAVSSLGYIFLITRKPLEADLALLNVSDWAQYLLAAVFGIGMLVCFCIFCKSNKVIMYAGRNSLFLFVFQNYLITSFNRFFIKVGILEDRYVVSLVTTVLTFVCLCSLCVLRDSLFNFVNAKLQKSFRPLI